MRRVRISSCRMPLMMALLGFGGSAGMELRDGQRVENFIDDVLGGDVLGLGLVGHRHAMTQHVEGDILDVLGHHEMAAVQESHGASGQGQGNGGARRGAVLDVAIEIERCGSAGGRVASTRSTM